MQAETKSLTSFEHLNQMETIEGAHSSKIDSDDTS